MVVVVAREPGCKCLGWKYFLLVVLGFVGGDELPSTNVFWRREIAVLVKGGLAVSGRHTLALAMIVLDPY